LEPIQKVCSIDLVFRSSVSPCIKKQKREKKGKEKKRKINKNNNKKRKERK